jgi:hypothetical protein
MTQRTGIFDSLARYVEHEWSKSNQNLEIFPALATEALQEFSYRLTQVQLEEELATWFQSRTKLPEQINLHNTFGQPPITLFNNERFVVDLYIWMGCDTSIHSHGFRGAFRVLHGKSLHETFRVKTVEAIAADVELTELGEPTFEILVPGATRTIQPGRDLTHRVIHLEEPTITLCVKTINEPTLSQWHHFENGLAIQKRHLEPGLIKQIYYFQYLAGQNGTLALKFLNDLLSRQDISTLMNLCEEISGPGYELSEESAQLVLEQIYNRYADTEWFARYERSAQAQSEDIFFALCASGVGRLATHFANRGGRFSEVEPHLRAVAGKSVSKKEIEEQIVSLIDGEDSQADAQMQIMRAFLDR